MQRLKTRTIAWIAGLAVTLAAGAAFAVNTASAQDKKPITIGFGMSLTGFLAANGKQALLGMKIWEEQTNKAGGLLGRPVKLVYYDDKSAPAEIPGIYTKLLDVDKVDLVLSAYATNDVAPAMPVIMRKGKTFISLFALDVNEQFHYPKYFSVLPTGQDTKGSFTEGFFDIAAQQNPKPQTVALSMADAEFSQNACAGARENARKHGFKIVYDQSLSAAAEDHRFRADRARDQSGECRSRRGLRLSARLGRHGARRQRSRSDAENVRRRPGRPAGHCVQGQAQGQAQRHRELRDLGAGSEADVSRHRGVL